jgi:hypothetical protein
MVVMLYIFAALEFIGGIGVIAWSRGAIPEILGTLLVAAIAVLIPALIISAKLVGRNGAEV